VAELTLLAHCGATLPRVLAGEIQADQVLSSTGASLVEHFFEASPTWNHAHRLMCACAEQTLSVWRDARRLRVLEIEAPDSPVLSPLDMNLPEARCDRVLAGTPGQLSGFDTQIWRSVRTQVWPPAKDASAMDDSAPYDLALVQRALSSAPDPLDVLDKIYDTLAPGGLAVLIEPTRSRFSDIVFGLRADDAPQASLTPAGITALLERAGFTDMTRHAESGLALEGAPHFVVARKPANEKDDNAPPADSAALAENRARHWLVLHTAAADANACTTLADALAQTGDTAASVPLEQAQAHIAELPSCELVFVAPVAPSNADAAAIMQAQETGVVAFARLVRQLEAGGAENLRLNILTRGGAPFPVGQTVTGAAIAVQPTVDDAPLHPEQASLWGLGRVLANEYPDWPARVIDMHPDGKTHDAFLSSAACALLAHELLYGDEEEVLLNAPGRWVPRMLPADEVARRLAEPVPQPAMLSFVTPGSLRNLEWFAQPDKELEPDQVEVQPYATGLNFRDVMYAMGLLSDEAVENGFAGASIGMELSGRVTRVGSAVKNFAPGDAVLGSAPAAFASRVRTRMAALAHKPDILSFKAAATIPSVFLTAYYALTELARLRRGERVLIHGGAGGVGIAAIQIARHFGAEVFATAGSNEKRQFVKLLGADHVFDSRSLAFADQILTLTNGQGVDIVLNSLAGEAMVRSIDTLRPFGRFLELGKRDFYENNQIGLRPLRNNISYFGIDADQLMDAYPELTSRLFGEIMELFNQGVLHPLPYRAFPAVQAEQAFRYMQQSRQIGKVLLTYPSGTPAPTHGLPQPPLPAFDPAGAYLIVGGTGGLGFVTARWMVRRGARHLTLASRGGKLNEAQIAEIETWREKFGTQVEAAACDVTNAAALAALVATIEARGTPVKGAVHSAMQIEDSLLRNLDDARFMAALAPKVAGAWNLHRVLGARKLDCFIVYSSMTTYLGSPGQGNYVAANSFLEALIALRRATGMKGIFMAWGPIEDVGFLARNTDTREQVQSRLGGASISSDEAMTALDAALAADLPGEAVVRLDWRKMGRNMPAAQGRRYAYMRARSAGDAAGGSEEGGSQLRAQVAALPPDQAQQLVAEVLRAQISRILHLSPERIDLDKSVLEMGMDSLMGMELGLAVQENFQVKLPVMAVSEGASVLSLAARIVASIQHASEDSSNLSTALRNQAEALAKIHAVKFVEETGTITEDSSPLARVSEPELVP
jgi:NADPH:quinone reductase-like Zn-dependent oxidoreductase/acyl carrier protein